MEEPSEFYSQESQMRSGLFNFIAPIKLALELDQFFSALQKGWIVDGRQGGLVIGRRHQEGNIYMIQMDSKGCFFCPASLEGGEYLVPLFVAQKNLKRLEEINLDTSHDFSLKKVNCSLGLRVLNVTANPFDKLLYASQGQLIVNRKATAKHLEELNDMVLNDPDFSFCNLEILRKD